MKTPVAVITLPLLLIGLAAGANADRRHHHGNHVMVAHAQVLEWDDNTWLDIDRGSVIISHKERGEPRSTVEITEKHELYIDDEKISLSPDQETAVGDFHDQCTEIIDYAKVIGWEGARVGLEGAKLGVKAVGGLFKLLLPDYDTDDYEAEMEFEASRIEARAERLEAKAELIEEMVEELDDAADDLRDAVPELRRLGWF